MLVLLWSQTTAGEAAPPEPPRGPGWGVPHAWDSAEPWRKETPAPPAPETASHETIPDEAVADGSDTTHPRHTEEPEAPRDEGIDSSLLLLKSLAALADDLAMHLRLAAEAERRAGEARAEAERARLLAEAARRAELVRELEEAIARRREQEEFEFLILSIV